MPKHSHSTDELDELRDRVKTLEDRERKLLDTIERLEMRADPEIIRLERLHALESMARGVAHNFNNILVGVMGYAQLIQMQSADPKSIQNADEIIRCANRARDLVERLNLSVGRTARVKSEILPLGSIIHGVLDTTRPRWKDEAEALGIPISLTTDLDKEAGAACISVDFHYTLVHLVFNAIEALVDGGGTIKIRARCEGDRANVQIIDDGVGMDDQTHMRMFEPFFTTKKDVGSGLGLSVVYRTVMESGGDISVDSSPGKGTTVSLSLALEEKAERPSPPTSTIQARSEATRIMVVDDEFAVRDVILQSLADREVSAFGSGAEALYAFEPGTYCVAFIDLGMPEMPGNEVARRLKGIDPDLVTVLVTGWELGDDDPIRDHFDRYIAKPFRVHDIRNMLELLGSNET